MYGIPECTGGENRVPVLVNGKKYYRTAEVYHMVGISRNTLFRWLQIGILGNQERRDRRGWRLFTDDEVETLKAEARRVSTVIRAGR